MVEEMIFEIITKRLYAKGKVSIKDIIDLVQGMIEPLDKRIEKLEGEKSEINSELQHALREFDTHKINELKPDFEQIVKKIKAVEEKKSPFINAYLCEGEGMTSEKIEELMIDLEKQGKIEPILDSKEKQDWLEEYKKHGLENDDNLWIKIGTIQWRYTTQGRKDYLDHKLTCSDK